MLILLAASFSDTERSTWITLLKELLPNDELVWQIDQSRRDQVLVAIVANPPVGSLVDLPNLKLIQSLWAGVDRLLLDASISSSVPICRMVDPAMNVAMAETALWAVLSIHRHFFEYETQQRQKIWKSLPQLCANEVKVSVLGMGQMGLCTAHRLALNGYHVSVWSSRERTAEEKARDQNKLEILHLYQGPDALDAVLSTADIVVNLLPLTPVTRGIINAKFLASLKDGAAICNLARGAHVVDDDLLAALDSGRIRRAVLDVFQEEPLPSSHRFWTHDRVTLLPHAAAQTDPRSAARIAVRNIEALRAGKAFENLVDRTKGY